MTVFWLVRHGTYDLLDRGLGGRGEYALNNAGRAEAAALAAFFAKQGVDAVASSPVRRAMETAAPIAGALAQTVTPEPGVAELDFGTWTGASFSELAGDPAWDEWNGRRGLARIPGGETMLEAQARAAGALLRLAGDWPGGSVVVVSHADIIKAVLTQVLGAPLDMMSRMEIAPASISRVRLGGGQAAVLDMNRR